MKRLKDILLGIAVIFSLICLVVLGKAYTVPRSMLLYHEIIRNYILVLMILVVVMAICIVVSAVVPEESEREPQ